MKTEKQRVKIRQITPEDLGVEESTKYREEIANDDPVLLEKERKRALFKLTIYGKGVLAKESIQQLRPMVENMSLADCTRLSDTLEKKGALALVAMLKKHEKEEKEKEKAKQKEQENLKSE